jgi:hypothetical protein
MKDKPIASDTIREWEHDPAWVDATRDIESIEDKTARMNPDAILAGIGFIHEYAPSPEGEAQVRAAIEAGFFHVLQGLGPDTAVYAVPRLIWPDEFCEKLYPEEGFSVSFGIQLGRVMLWGPPGLIESRPWRKNNDRRPIHLIEEALRRFKKGTRKDKEAVVLTVRIKGTDRTEQFRARPDLTEFLVEHWDEPDAIDAMCNRWPHCSDAEYERASVAASHIVMANDREKWKRGAAYAITDKQQ